MENIEIINRKIIQDSRGWFLKAITGHEANLPCYTGEVYVVSGFPGENRGSHYHLKANEWFTLLSGKVLLRLKNIETQEEGNIILSMDSPKTIMVSPLIAHRFDNLEDSDFILLAYTDLLYEPNDTIPYVFD